MCLLVPKVDNGTLNNIQLLAGFVCQDSKIGMYYLHVIQKEILIYNLLVFNCNLALAISQSITDTSKLYNLMLKTTSNGDKC